MGNFIGAIRYQMEKLRQRPHYQEELDKMEQRRKGIIPPQFERLKALENSCQGKRCFIVADGTGVSPEVGKRLEKELVFGVNSGTQLKWKGWKPGWLGIQSPQAYEALEKELSQYELVFAGDNLAGRFHLPEQVVQYPYLGVYKYYVNRYQEYGVKFSGNALEVVYDGYSVIYSMLQIAVYLGIKEIYLLGCSQPEDARMTAAYRTAAQYAEEHGIRICNCTPGEQEDVFAYCPVTDLFD